MTADEPRYSKEVLALALARESVARLKRWEESGHYSPTGREDLRHLLTAFDALDNSGVFAPVDRQTDYTAAPDVLAANAEHQGGRSPGGLAFSQIRHPSGQRTGRWAVPDPATPEQHTEPVIRVQDETVIRHPGPGQDVRDYVERYGAGPENIQPLTPLTQEQARALFGDSPRGTVGLPLDVEAGLKEVLESRHPFGDTDEDDGRF